MILRLQVEDGKTPMSESRRERPATSWVPERVLAARLQVTEDEPVRSKRAMENSCSNFLKLCL